VKRILWFTPPFALLGVLCTGCQSAETAATSTDGRFARDTQIAAVEVVRARQGGLPLVERLTGTVRAAGEVAIFPEIDGPVVEVYVDNGDAVRRGDPLVRLRDTGSQSQLDQARSGLAAARAEVKQAQAVVKEAETQFNRIQVLVDRGLMSVSESDTQRALVETARATLARASAQVAVAEALVAERADVLRQAIVRAPITGRIGQRNVEVGMRVDTQTPLFVIGRLENMRVEVPVTQDMLASIEIGQPVEIRPGGRSATPVRAQVSRISPFLQETSLSAEVEIDVRNNPGHLVPGMFVTVDMFYGESDEATLVPTSALYDHPITGERGVFVWLPAPTAVDTQALVGEASGLSPEPVDIVFRVVEVVAEGAQVVAIDGVASGTWVVVVGQHLLAAQQGSDPPQARVRVIDWDRIIELQGLQGEDLLQQFMERQQRLMENSS
jgi:RND family efflux transporter MFP subunit